MSTLSTKDLKRKYANFGIQGNIETPRVYLQVYRLHYYHDNCVTEETKRKLHTAPSGSKQPPKKKAKKDTDCNTSTSNAKKKSAAKQTQSNNSTTRRQLKPKIRKQLEKDLRQLRTCYATTQGNCEEYKIFSNKSLTELLTKLPTNDIELSQCWGIKGKRIKQYGKSILTIINSYLDKEQQEQQGGSGDGRRRVQTTIPMSPPTSRRTTATVNNSSSASTSSTVASSSPAAAAAAAAAVVTPAKLSTMKKEEDTTDDEDEIVIGPTISVEEIVRRSVQEAEVRGEVLEIL